MALTGSESTISQNDQARLKKRKRAELSFEELEVDVNASEPLSKKAERKLKRRKSIAAEASPSATVEHTKGGNRDDQEEPAESSSKRSEYGIWIGNLPWTATRAHVREFFTKDGAIRDQDITRVHLPTTKRPVNSQSTQNATQNKGFAYVDFASQECLDAALAMSDILLSGRRVLIKDARNFEGRPAAAKGPALGGRPPNRRVFVGNLDFEMTEVGLRDHFSKCGDVDTVFTATFEDSGKCKGYAWITFAEISSAEQAVRGWVYVQADEESVAKTKKWWLHRLNGRNLRVEFAEDDTTRYQKRFGKKDANGEGNGAIRAGDTEDDKHPTSATQDSMVQKREMEKQAPEKREAKRPERSKAKSPAMPAAPTVAHRLTGAMVESTGRKTVFD